MLKQLNFTGTMTRRGSAIRVLAVALTAFAASAGSVSGWPSYLNVGLSVIFEGCALPVFLASALYYLAAGAISKGIVPLSSMLLIALFRLFVRSFTALRAGSGSDPLLLGAVSALIPGVLSAVYSSAVAAPSGDILAAAGGSVMLGCFVFSFVTLHRQFIENGRFAAEGLDLLHLAVIYISLVSALCGASLAFIDLGRVLACAVLLLAAKKRGAVGGAAFGALTTCAVMLGAPYLARSTLILAAAGLICGAFSQLGILAVSLSFIVTCAAGLVTSGIGADTFNMFADAAAGAMIFALIPERTARRFSTLVFGSTSVYSALGSTTSSRLSFVSKTLSDIRRQIVLVNSALERKHKAPSPSDTAWDELCAGCQKRKSCFPDETAQRSRLSALAETVIRVGEITSAETAAAFPACPRPELLADSFNYSATELAQYRAWRIRSSQLRSLLCEQLTSMEELLSDLSFRVGNIRSVDPVLSAKLVNYFSSLGYRNVKACAVMDPNGFRRAEVYLPCAFRGDVAAAALAVSDITDADLELPVIDRSGGLTRLVFHEQTVYSADCGTYSAAGSASPVSGDIISIIDLPSGDVCAVLADGMGTGARARLDAAFAADLAGRLLTSGVSMRTALRLVNSALLTKNEDESFAAVDILTLDLFAGTAELLKAGAAPTYLFRDGVFRAFGDRSFPAGILDSAPPDSFSCKLFDGDYIVMTSDGVDLAAVQLLSELSRKNGLSAKEIAAAIGSCVLEKYEKQSRRSKASLPPRDDVSVAVFRIGLRNSGF